MTHLITIFGGIVVKHIVKSVALVLALLALCAGICAVAEEEIEPIPLTLNVEAEAVIEQAGGYAYFSFTPEETDWYEFTSLADTDTLGYLYDEDMNQLSSNDDGGTGYNFKISYELEEGVPYIFGVRYYSSSNTGSFNVVLRSSNHLTASAVDGNNKYVVPEGSVDLEVSASCKSGELHYQWYGRVYDEYGSYTTQAIEGASSPSYTVENVSRQTQYYCLVSDDFDNSIQVWFYIIIDNQFTAGAVGSTSKYVEPEADVDLEVSASCNSGELYYQWYGRVYYEDGSYTTQAIEGATTNSYTVQNAVRYTSYYCRVSDDFGNTTNVWFYIHIDNQLTVNAVGSSNKYVELGVDVELAVTASCKSGELHYQWMYRDEDTGNYLTISGADSASLRVENVQRWCEYRCDVSDDYGNSRNLYFHISIENHLSVERIGKYRVSVLPGETAALAVSASCASGGLYYQWYDGDEDEPIEGATGSSYVLENYMGRGEFYCRVEDDYGNSDTVWFYAYLDNGLNVDDRYVQVAVPYGETATLTVSAYCDDGPITYQWLQETYDEEEDEWYSVEIEGADTDTWITEPVTASADYWCKMSDQYGNYVETRFEVFVQNGFSASRVSEQDVVFAPEDTAILEVEAHCDEGELTYDWGGEFYDGEDWDYRSLDADGPTCTLPEDFRRGEIYCTVSDMYGQHIVIDFYPSVESDLEAHTEDDTVLRLAAGSTATLRITATHSEQYGELRYRWYKNGHFIEGATAAEYTTPPLTASARFYCEVQDDYSDQRVEFLCIVNDVAIALDTPTEVTLENYDMRYFAFTPAETDTYTLESDGNHDTYVYLFDADFEELARNDDGGDDTNFKLTRELVAGQKYYYGIRFYDDESGTFTVLLTRGGGSSSAERYHLYLRPGQTVSFPDVDHEEWSESVEELYSPNSGLLDTDGTSVTALAAGTAELVVRYSENERIYTVDIVDGVQIATPAALREIQEEAFADDASLQFVVLGDAVTRVGKNAFRGSGLKQIVVPSRTTILTAASMRGTTEDLVIVCRRNSRAAKFAQDHEIEYVYMD